MAGSGQALMVSTIGLGPEEAYVSKVELSLLSAQP